MGSNRWVHKRQVSLGVSTWSPLFLVIAVLASGITQGSAQSAAYYGYTAYTEFNSGSSVLGSGSGTSLSLRFQFCEVGGVLMETVGGNGGEYFTVGITSTQQLLLEFTNNTGGITQVTNQITVNLVGSFVIAWQIDPFSGPLFTAILASYPGTRPSSPGP